MVYESYLTHYGIEGQKWGVKNGPPYPLRASSMSAAEKKEAKRQKNIATGTERLKNRLKRADSEEETDAQAAKLGWENTKKAGQAQQSVQYIKNLSNEILADEARLERLGEKTNHMRTAIKVGAAVTAAVLAPVSLVGVDTLLLNAGMEAVPALISAIGSTVLSTGVVAGAASEAYDKTKY
jgi:hypothetical protein